MKYEVHLIQPIAVNRMNTNGDKQPKTIDFGGYTRARLSSQSQKYASRKYTQEFGLLDQNEIALRTRKFTQLIQAELEKQGFSPDDAITLAQFAMSAIGMSHKKGDDKKFEQPLLNEYMILCCQSEIDAFVAAVIRHQDAIRKVSLAKPVAADEETPKSNDSPVKSKSKLTAKKALARQFPEVVRSDLAEAFIAHRNLEVTLYGRQLADFPEGTVDGQVQVAHAIAVNYAPRELDFFVSIDDLAAPGEAEAGMLDDLEVTAPTLYRTAAVNTSQIARALGSYEAAVLGTKAFLEAFTASLPAGGKNSYHATTAPTFVLFREVRRGSPLSFAPAFENPVRPERHRSLSEMAVARLDEYIRKLETAFPSFKSERQCCINLTDYEFQNAPSVKNLRAALEYMLQGRNIDG